MLQAAGYTLLPDAALAELLCDGDRVTVTRCGVVHSQLCSLVVTLAPWRDQAER